MVTHFQKMQILCAFFFWFSKHNVTSLLIYAVAITFMLTDTVYIVTAKICQLIELFLWVRKNIF